MKKGNDNVTQAMRILKQKKIDFEVITYNATEQMLSDNFGEAIAELTGIDEMQAFKTLVAKGDNSHIIVLVIPVCKEVDLKKVAKAIGCKKVEMIHVKELLGLTGYIRGSVSPIGMKKQYDTIISDNANNFEWIAVSGGRCGITLKISTDKLIDAVNATVLDITR